MNKADEIFELLKDGAWHELAEIIEDIKLSPERLDIILKFLADFGFIEHRGGKKIRLTQPTRKWLIEIR